VVGGGDLPFDAVNVAKSIKIAATLGTNEVDSVSNIAGTKVDDAGVVASNGAELVRVADAATVTAAAKAVTVDFDDSSNKAIGISGSTGYVATFQVTLRDADKKALALKLKTGVTNLDGKFLVELFTDNNLEPGDSYFKWFPAGATQIDLSALAQGKITFTLPKELIRSNLTSTKITFLDKTPSDGNLVNDADVTGDLIATVNGNDINVLPGAIFASLPLTVGSNSSNLYAQRISQKVTGDDATALEDTLVTSYLAKWQDKEVAGATTVSVTGGKVSIPGDKWATDVVLADGGGAFAAFGTSITNELAKTKPAVTVPGYVVVTRSNDLVKGGSNAGNGQTTGNNEGENYYVATAKLYSSASTAATAAANAKNEATAFEVAIDVKTGKITGRLAGDLKLSSSVATTSKRGLVFIDRDGSLSDTAGVQSFDALVKNGRIDTLVGVDAAKVPADKDLAAVLKDAFVLMVHEDKDGNKKLITSAETGASNFLPFAANLLNKDGLGQIQGTATDGILNISKVGSATVAGSGSWQLVGLNALSRAKGAKTALSLPRTLIGLNGGTPTSIWSNDGAHKDLALTMLGNSVGTAVEAKDKDVETVALGTNASAEGFAFAFNNDGLGYKVFVANAAAADVKLKAGWNLVSLPKAISTSALPGGVSMLLTSDLKGSWVKANASGAADANFNLSAGAPVFVYLKDAKAGDNLAK